MKIIYKIGNLLEAKERFILHGCNSSGYAFSSGVAGEIRKKYPQAYDAYINTSKKRKLILGQTIWVSTNDDRTIINAITQKTYGNNKNILYVSYDAIKIVILDMNTFFSNSDNKEIMKIGMPLIGCGLANGDWKIVSKIIEEESTNFQPVVYLLSYEDAEREGIIVS